MSEPCETCGGSGVVTTDYPGSPWSGMVGVDRCDDCGGSGEAQERIEYCRNCDERLDACTCEPMSETNERGDATSETQPNENRGNLDSSPAPKFDPEGAGNAPASLADLAGSGQRTPDQNDSSAILERPDYFKLALGLAKGQTI